MTVSRIPSGMRYYIGPEAHLRRRIEDQVMSVFQGWSYEEIITPSVDYYSLFEQGMGHAEARTAFRFTDNDGHLLSLRPDVTSSIARAAATMLSRAARPLRFCYASPVFRQQLQSRAEWRRENTQLGCELIGNNGTVSDVEILLVATEILSRLELANQSVITLSHVGIFDGLFDQTGLDHNARQQILTLLNVMDQAELLKTLNDLKLSPTDITATLSLQKLSGDEQVLTLARKTLKNPKSLAALDSLQQVWTIIKSLGLENRFAFDLADVSGLEYYTGIIFKIYIEGAGYRVGRGGRYDGLTSKFGAGEPAIGFVLSLDVLTEVLAKQLSDFNDNSNPTFSITNDELRATFAEAFERRSKRDQIRIEVRD
jgi:ATP phosphoribosyltransferase regulatory subunit